MKNRIFTEYNINVISLNWLINNIIEPAITRYCVSINFQTNKVSRDSKKLFFHFIADTIVSTLSEFSNEKNILIFDEQVELNLFTEDFVDITKLCCNQIVKKFNLCTFFSPKKLVDLTIEDIYKIKLLSDNCSIKTKNLSRLKKFLETNNYTALSKQLKSSKITQMILTT